jgi:hypothetical protein
MKYCYVFKMRNTFLPADKVTQACSISPLSLTFVGGHGGDKRGERTGRGADGTIAPH